MINSEKQFNSMPSAVQAIIIIATLGIIAFIWAITISPIEFIRFERDRQRVRDLRIFSSALQEINISNPQFFNGQNKLVYISLPDKNPDCSNWKLPELNNNYYYRCVSAENLRRIDSFGWLPVDFSSLKSWSLAELPVDSKTGFYYQYISGSFVVTAKIESSKMTEQLSEAFGLSLSRDFERFLKGGQPLAQQILVDSATLAVGKIKNYIDSRPVLAQQKIFEEIKAAFVFVDPAGNLSDKFINDFWLSTEILSPAVKDQIILKPTTPEQSEVYELILQVLGEKPSFELIKPKSLQDQLFECYRSGGTARINNDKRLICCPSVQKPLQ